MSLCTWLLAENSFFRDMRHHLVNVLTKRHIKCLDDLVVYSRRPVRTILLVLDDLVRSGKIEITSDRIIPKGSDGTVLSQSSVPQLTWGRASIIGDLLRGQYHEMVATRETPALLWGQRRLVPKSAIDRALYILTWLEHPRGTIVFIGDDDLVSPLVAASAPGWNVCVIDIDRVVLQQAQQIASRLGTKLSTIHTDVSQGSVDYQEMCDVIVGDPFPSGDGSFETMFWRHAARMLRSEGILITTVAPSHKPIAYAVGALHQLHLLGFCLIDLQADYGRYEVFDFEFIPFEKRILSQLCLQSTVSHTKSILAARFAPSDALHLDIDNASTLSFGKWCRAAMGHYLTVQAGVDRQRQITIERGVQADSGTDGQIDSQDGLRIDAIFTPELGVKLTDTAGSSIEETINLWDAMLLKNLGIKAEVEELRELARLATTSKLQPEGPLAQLGLAIRAIESWDRWRFDE